MSFDRDSARLAAVLLLTAAMAFAVSPFLTAGFNGFSPEQFPVPQIDAPIQPAGWAFSIWGLIYVWLLLHAGFGLIKRDDDPDWMPMRWPLFASLAIGASWITVAQQSVVIATIQIWIMLIAALIAMLRSPSRDRWWAQAPVAIYAGWLTAASFVALGLTLAGFGIGLAATGWAIVGLAVLTGFAVAIQRQRVDAPEYGLTVIWALAGILAGNLISSPGIAALAALAIVVMGIVLAPSLRRAL